MIGHGAKFGRKKEAAVAALLTARNTEQAARSIGIGPATLRRWQKEPEFDAAFRAAQRLSYKQPNQRMHASSLQRGCGRVLHKVMVDPATPAAASTKVGSGWTAYNHTARAIEIEDIELRVAALEATSASGAQRG